MGSRVKSKNEVSLCEKSMKVVANIIRLSSFSIAEKTLGTTGKAAKDVLISESDMVPEKEPLVPEFAAGKRRSQEPQNRANPTYMIKPDGRTESTSPVPHHERVHVKPRNEDGVDGLASDYIKKIRDQLGCS